MASKIHVAKLTTNSSRPDPSEIKKYPSIIPDGWLDAEATAPPDALADASVSGG
jgi:hypothetical protein